MGHSYTGRSASLQSAPLNIAPVFTRYFDDEVMWDYHETSPVNWLIKLDTLDGSGPQTILTVEGDYNEATCPEGLGILTLVGVDGTGVATTMISNQILGVAETPPLTLTDNDDGTVSVTGGGAPPYSWLIFLTTDGSDWSFFAAVDGTQTTFAYPGEPYSMFIVASGDRQNPMGSVSNVIDF
jgi:hypothetical protein